MITVVTVWFLIAVGVGYAGLLARAPVPPPAIAFAMSAACLVMWRAQPFNEAVRRAGPRPILVFHLVTRALAGSYFLSLYSRGDLPGEFARVGGYGDIVVAIGAAGVLRFCLPIVTRRQETALLLWNAVGLADILIVLSRGIRMLEQDPAIGEQFTSLPLALLPTFLVPLIIASHVVLFVSRDTRLRR